MDTQYQEWSAKFEKLLSSSKFDDAIATERTLYSSLMSDLAAIEFHNTIEKLWLTRLDDPKELSIWESRVVSHSALGQTLKNAVSLLAGKRRIVVLAVTNLTLANGLSLLEILTRLKEQEKKETLVWMLNPISPIELGTHEKVTGVTFASLNNCSYFVSSLVLGHALRKARPRSNPVSVCFWSVPLGLPLTFITLRAIGGKNVSLCHFPTKYGICYSEAIVDKHIGISSKSFLPRISSHKIVPPLPYPNTSLVRTLASPSKPEIEIASFLRELKIEGRFIVTSMCRNQKLQSERSLEIINSILEINKECILLLFTKGLGDIITGIHESLKPQVVTAPWLNRLTSIISLIDLYLDPVPHGGGYALELALSNGVPSIIPAIAALHSHIPSPKLDFIEAAKMQPCARTDHIIFPDSDDLIATHVRTLVTSKSARTAIGNRAHAVWRLLEQKRKAFDASEYITI